MNKKQELIAKYKREIAKIEGILATKSLELGMTDSAKESRFPTGRYELEEQIYRMQDRLAQLKENLTVIENLPESIDDGVVRVGVFVSIALGEGPREYFIVPRNGDFDLGTLSAESPLGETLLGKRAGDSVTLESGDVTVVGVE